VLWELAVGEQAGQNPYNGIERGGRALKSLRGV